MIYRSRYIDKDSMKNCIERVKNEIWDNIQSMTQANDILNAFLNTFFVHFESSFPVHYVTKKHKTNYWVTAGIRTS